MLTRNGCLSWERSLRSFITELTERLEMMRALLISFMANSFLFFFFSTFQTLPKPPRPTQYWKLKWFFVMAERGERTWVG